MMPMFYNFMSLSTMLIVLQSFSKKKKKKKKKNVDCVTKCQKDVVDEGG